MSPKKANNLNIPQEAGNENCSVCRDLLTHMEQFFDMLQSTRKSLDSDWLTVGEIASELKISKSIVYRFIRNGELEAIDIVDNAGKIAQKGHYRIKKTSLNKFLEAKKVKSLPVKSSHSSRPMMFPKVKNHLGI